MAIPNRERPKASKHVRRRMLFQTDVSNEKVRRVCTRADRSFKRSIDFLEARTSMVDGFPYKEEVGGSSPSVPTNKI